MGAGCVLEVTLTLNPRPSPLSKLSTLMAQPAWLQATALLAKSLIGV